MCCINMPYHMIMPLCHVLSLYTSNVVSYSDPAPSSVLQNCPLPNCPDSRLKIRSKFPCTQVPRYFLEVDRYANTTREVAAAPTITSGFSQPLPGYQAAWESWEGCCGLPCLGFCLDFGLSTFKSPSPPMCLGSCCHHPAVPVVEPVP